MRYSVQLSTRASKYLKKVSKKVARQLVAGMESLGEEPRPCGCQKIKEDKERYKIQSGNYRIIYEIRDKVLLVLVVRIGHRQDVYKQHRRSRK